MLEKCVCFLPIYSRRLYILKSFSKLQVFLTSILELNDISGPLGKRSDQLQHPHSASFRYSAEVRNNSGPFKQYGKDEKGIRSFCRS